MIVQTSKDLDPRCPLWRYPEYLCNIYEWELGSRGKHIFITTFMKHIQFCILARNQKENLSQDIPDTHSDCIHLTIISNQCCVLVILMQEI